MLTDGLLVAARGVLPQRPVHEEEGDARILCAPAIVTPRRFVSHHIAKRLNSPNARSAHRRNFEINITYREHVVKPIRERNGFHDPVAVLLELGQQVADPSAAHLLHHLR